MAIDKYNPWESEVDRYKARSESALEIELRRAECEAKLQHYAMMQALAGQRYPSPVGLAGLGGLPSPQQAGAQAGAGVASPKPKLALPVETAFGELLAWRIWKLKAGFLRSAYKEDLWLPGETYEAKGVEDHNSAGFHAWKAKLDAVRYAMEQKCLLVIGQVRLWGIVIHHERGYRAQFARLASLDDLSDPTSHLNLPLLEALRAKYLPAPVGNSK